MKPLRDVYDAVKPTYRKFALFCCAWVRYHWNELTDMRSRNAVDAMELFVDYQFLRENFRKVSRAAWNAVLETSTDSSYISRRRYVIRRAAYYTGFFKPSHLYDTVTLNRIFYAMDALILANQNEQIRLFHEVCTTPNYDREFFNGTVISLAQNAYEKRDYTILPILGDALEEAGCTDKKVLEHCHQSTNTHCHGCWVLDWVLRKHENSKLHSAISSSRESSFS